MKKMSLIIHTNSVWLKKLQRKVKRNFTSRSINRLICLTIGDTPILFLGRVKWCVKEMDLHKMAWNVSIFWFLLFCSKRSCVTLYKFAEKKIQSQIVFQEKVKKSGSLFYNTGYFEITILIKQLLVFIKYNFH